MKLCLQYTDLVNGFYSYDLIKYITQIDSKNIKLYIVINEKYNYDMAKLKIKFYERKIKKYGFSKFHVILTDDPILEVCDRNNIDVLFSSCKINCYNQFIKIIDLNKGSLSTINQINDYIKWCETPLVGEVDNLTKPSKDKIWMKYYNKKALSDLKRFSLVKNETMYKHIVKNNSDFLHEIALEISGTDTKITYKNLEDNVKKYKKAFINDGIKAGDVVTLSLPNVPASIYSFFALQEIGAIPSMVHTFTKKDTMNKYFKEENTKAVIMIGMQDVYDTVKEAINGTNVKRVICVPLSDSLSIKYKFGLKLVNSKFGKIFLGKSNIKGSYLLDKKISLKEKLACIENLNGNFKLREDDIFISLNNFLNNSFNNLVDDSSTKNDIATIIHTGGTTGCPKAAMLSHENLNSNIDFFEATIQNFDRGETLIAIPPMFHVLGLNNCIYLPLRVGAKTVLVPKYNKTKIPEIYKKYKPEYFFAVPKIGYDIIHNADNFKNIDLSCLKYIVFGGEEMNNKFLNKFQRFLDIHNSNIMVSQSLGATEASCSMTNTFNNCNVLGSLGIPLIGLNAKIVKIKNENDDDYNNIEEVGYDEIGEICFSGDSIMLGYLQSKSNYNTLRKHNDGKIWLHTADAGYIDRNGILYFSERIKDMIKINGEQVYVSEIKKIIMEHPLVDNCAISCILDKDDKKKVIATITLKDNEYLRSPEKIKDDIYIMCKTKLIKEAVPREVVITEKLPETMYFKVDTTSLENKYQQREKVLQLNKNI